MRFLADENFPVESALHLERAGQDVELVVRQFPPREDPDVLDQAVREQRILLTFDSDFGTLIYHEKLQPPPGVVFYRLPPHAPLQPALLLTELIAHGEFQLEGMFTTVDLESVRQRPLPPTSPPPADRRPPAAPPP